MINPYLIHFYGQTKIFEIVIEVSSLSFITSCAVFKVHDQTKRGRQTKIDYMPEVMVKKYFPNHLITSLIDISKTYKQARLQ